MSALTVVGAGYVGLVTATCMAALGHDVVVMDVDREKIELLRKGGSSIYEPDLVQLISSNRSHLRFTDDPTDAYAFGRFIFLCVDTPPAPSGSADLSSVWRAVAQLATQREDLILVMKSTVPVGTGAAIQAMLQEQGLSHIAYASNPEFLREGSALDDFMHADRVVIGAEDPSVARQVALLYEGLACPVLTTDVATSEMIKYACNAFLATKVSFINEIANVCESTGADVSVVAQGMGMDHRIGPHFLQAGIGYGGSCFPKDVSALKQIAADSGYHFQLLSAVIAVNDTQKSRVVDKLKRNLGGELRGKRIALLGLAFKPNTDDIRQASSLAVASRLLTEGVQVVCFDPLAMDNMRSVLPDLEYAASGLDALRGAEACVLVTEWQEFLGLDWQQAKDAMARPIIIDGRNALDGQKLRTLGFAYEGVGKMVSRETGA